MMTNSFGIDAFGNPDELTRLKGKRTRLEMELATVNDRIKRIEDNQFGQAQAERSAFLRTDGFNSGAQLCADSYRQNPLY